MIVRSFWVWLHRWVGLTTAAFLILVGLSGSLLAFLPELSRLLAPSLHPGAHAGLELDPATLARRAEQLAPDARATTVYLGEEGVASIGMQPRAEDHPLDFNAIILDRVSGAELGRLKRTGWPSSAASIMPFIYSLHYELALGDIGEWILGVVALLWTLDCFVALYLTLPMKNHSGRKSFFEQWKPAWLIKLRASFYRMNFDLHRAGGLWLWCMLLIFAWSSVFFDLNGFYTRVIRVFADYDPPVWALAAEPDLANGGEPLSWESAQETGARLMREQAEKHGFSITRVTALYFLADHGVYEYRVRSSRDIGDKNGSTSLTFNAYTGEFKTIRLPTGQRAGTTFTSWMTELHMANLFGLPYRMFVSALGLAIVMLSATGLYIWWKKRNARQSRRQVEEQRILETPSFE